MKELTQAEIETVAGGALPVLLAYYIYMGSSISSVYSVAKFLGNK